MLAGMEVFEQLERLSRHAASATSTPVPESDS
jgi:hypothetical protein